MPTATLALAPLLREPGCASLPRQERRPLLVRTPAQYHGESPLGFVLRASEMNGYETPRRLFALAGAARDETFTVGLDMVKVASVLGRDADHFRGYREQGETDASRVHLNGHPLAARDFDLSAPKICPECVQEHGFIPAWTDLHLMDACPKHARKFRTACLACGETLSWFRPAVLRCQCGAALDDARGEPIFEEHAVLLALVVAKASNSTRDAPSLGTLNPCKMPVAQFDRMTLRGMLAMARSLARLDRGVPASVAARAGQLFSRWPENLFAVLRELVPSDAAAGRTVAMRQHMEGLYRVILKDIAAAPDITFLRATIGAFAGSLQANVPVKPEGSANLTGASPQPSSSMWAPAMSVTPPVASTVRATEALVAAPVAPLKRRASGKRQRAQPLAGARSFSAREVARRLELPVSVLLYLRRVGHFEVRHRASRVVAFHEEDVDAFENKIRAFCAGVPALRVTATVAVAPKKAEVLTFAKVLAMNFKFEEGKGELVAAILDGTFPCFAASPGNLSLLGLLLDKVATLAHIGRLRASAFGNAVTPAEASKTLYCDPLVIPSLVAAGHLVGQQHEAGLRIPRESVQKFAAKYCTMAELAKASGTSSRALQRYITAAGIELLFFERGHGKGAQPFVRRQFAKDCRLVGTFELLRKNRVPTQ